jgi:hypothetical protein
MKGPIPLPQDGFVRVSDIVGNPKKGVRGYFPFSRATLYQMIKDGKFPSPDKRFGERISAWHVDVIRPLLDPEEAA